MAKELQFRICKLWKNHWQVPGTKERKITLQRKRRKTEGAATKDSLLEVSESSGGDSFSLAGLFPGKERAFLLQEQ